MKVKDNVPYMVSYFDNIRGKKPKDIMLEQFIADVRNGRWKSETENIRQLKANGQEQEAASIKSSLPAIAVACLCRDGHQEKNIHRLTGLIPVDLDHTDCRTHEVFARVCQLPYVVAAMISASGAGVKVIVSAEMNGKEDYPVFFKQAATCIADETCAVVDASGKNVNRLCFASYHPEAYYNPHATALPVAIAAVPVASAALPVAAFDEKSEKIFLAVMRAQSKKDTYHKGNRNNYIYALACALRRKKMDEVQSCYWCARYFDLPADEIEATVHSAYGNGAVEQQMEADEKRRAEAARKRQDQQQQIEEFIRSHYDLRYNVVLKQVEVRHKATGGTFQPMPDYDENSIYRALINSGHKISTNNLHTLLNSNMATAFDPFEHYFNSLPAWDGATDYIGMLAATVTTTQPEHWQACFRKWLVAMVAGWLIPEVVNHTVLVLIGKQGIYKTTWCLHLLPPELKRYRYSGVVDSRNKDMVITLSQCGLINYEEIENLDRKELNTFKSLVTQSVINERLFYGKNKEWMNRRASIIGSGNNKDILTDLTGNRRWLCFEVTDIAPPTEHTLPYAGIYAQAKALLDSGFQYWFDKAEMEALTQQNSEFVLRSMEEEQLAVWFRKPEQGEKYTLMTATQVASRLASWACMQMDKVKTGRALKAAGYESKILHNRVKVYFVVEKHVEEVKVQGLHT